MNKMFLNKTEKKYLENLFEILEPLKQNILYFKLFGSKARGDFSDKSDIDLLLVVDNGKKEIFDEKISRFVTETLLENGPFFSIKIYSSKEFRAINSPPTFFIRKIEKEAVNLKV